MSDEEVLCGESLKRNFKENLEPGVFATLLYFVDGRFC